MTDGHGKTALVTGASSGIGKAFAELLAEKGYTLVLTARRGDRLEALAAELQTRHGVAAHTLVADLAEPGAPAAIAAELAQRKLAIDVLVNNAGYGVPGSYVNVSWADHARFMQVMVTAVLDLTYRLLPGMLERGWGRIINIASAHGLVASGTKAAYVAAKHGLVGLTKVVALETARSAITCNAICPGWVLTPLVQKQIDDWAARDRIPVEEAKVKLLGEKQPSLEFVTPEQIGALAVFLCSGAADQMRGAALAIDGGWTAQ
jgi:3-hydroxybutyrate dehydrogenase